MQYYFITVCTISRTKILVMEIKLVKKIKISWNVEDTETKSKPNYLFQYVWAISNSPDVELSMRCYV